jgi:hypothetical protein
VWLEQMCVILDVTKYIVFSRKYVAYVRRPVGCLAVPYANTSLESTQPGR